ncbi:MAG: hypothetical protein K2X93_00810 [Candidatus Obscuribacterales bacterium]|nr:hypothetical protein [Candidatus Obscuribacterales bacterium]
MSLSLVNSRGTLVYLFCMVAYATCVSPFVPQVAMAQTSRSNKPDKSSPQALLKRLHKLHESNNYAEERTLELNSLDIFRAANKNCKLAFTRLTMDNADKHFQKRQFGHAIALCEAIEGIDPAWGHPHYYIGLAMLEKGQRWKATTEIEKAISLTAPGSPELEVYHSTLAQVFKELGKPDLATPHLSKTMKTVTDNALGLENEIHLLLQRRNSKEALTKISKLRALSKDTEMRTRCLWLRAVALSNEGMVSDSVELCRLVLKEPVSHRLHLEALLTLIASLCKQHQEIEAKAVTASYYENNKKQFSADDLDRLASVLFAAKLESWKKFRQLADSAEPSLVAAKSIQSEFSAGQIAEGARRLNHLSSEKEAGYSLTATLIKTSGEDYLLQTALLSNLYKLLQRSDWDQQKLLSLSEWNAMLEKQTWSAFNKTVEHKSNKSNKKYIDALEQVRKGMKLAPSVADQLVLFYACSDDLPEALKKANEVVVLYPGNVQLRKLRAALSLRMGDDQQVAEDLQHLSSTPTTISSIEELQKMQSNWEANTDKTELHRRLWNRNYKDTNTYLIRKQHDYLEQIPHAASTEHVVSLLKNAAKMSIGRGSYTEALEILDRAIKVAGTDYQIYELKSWCLVGLNRRDQAQEARKTALQLRKKFQSNQSLSP